MTHTWDPEHYLTYADERGRPFVELLGRIASDEPRSVIDLGCGAGNLTAIAASRWPRAQVAGLDSSAEMIARAERDYPGLDFAVEDLRDFLTGNTTPVDVLLSNATLQWVAGHLDLMPDLVRNVRPGGWLAFQVPGNFDEPSHTLRAELAAEPEYAAYTEGVSHPNAHDAATYLRGLVALGCTVDAWETTYLHVLTGEDPVFTWVSGTGARPTLQALPGELRDRFEAEFKRRLRAAYPPLEQGTFGGGERAVVLPFRRVFVVAQVPA